MIADGIRAELYGGPRDGEQVDDLDLEPSTSGGRPEPPEQLARPNVPPPPELPANHPSMLWRQPADGIAVYELARDSEGAYPNWMINRSGRLVYTYVRSVVRRRERR